MLDHYLSGKVDRISPEAPVPVVKLDKNEFRLGGAANVALNVQAFGAVPVIFSIVGRDKNGNVLRDLIEQSGMEATYIFNDPSRPTTRKTRILAGYQQLLRVDEEDTKGISDTLKIEILEALKKSLQHDPPAVIIFQDYNKGLLTADFIRQILSLASNHNIPTVVDPKFDQFFAFEGCTLFKPNLKELSEGLGQKIKPTSTDLQAACLELSEKMNPDKILITLSENGVYAYENSTGALIPVKSREIIDVCGAGDAVIATAAIGEALGLPLAQIAKFANIAGGIVCESMGVIPVNFNKLAKEIGEMYSTHQ